jgi:para-nitrobenzyl esterase
LQVAIHVAIAALFVVGLAPLAACGDAGLRLDEVRLDSGVVTGSRAGDVWSFKGIPYAAPPVGDLRWRAPQPVTPWAEPRACTAFGPACPQPSSAEAFYLAVGETSEDCLYLNVWAPDPSSDVADQSRRLQDEDDDLLPVMVWIHGGSFETGAGSMAVYDGANLASMGVVVVTINYRLGPLGFLAHPALSAESQDGGSGNYGLLDQVAALKWVQRNIAAFGGDPQRVTVFGESAGAISILDLLVSPLAEGLFQRAIVQSGIILDQGFGVTTNGTLAQAEEEGVAFAERLGVEASLAPAEIAAALRAKTPEELLAVSGQSGSVMEQGLRWKPVADGYMLPDVPTKLWAEGRHHKMPLLIGSNLDEGNLFLQGLTLEPAQYEQQMQAVFGPYTQEALALYPVKSADDITPAFSRMLTEVGFASTARFAARAMSATGSPAYLYQFTRVPFDNPMGAFHGVEIPYVFGNTALFSVMGAIEQADTDLSAALMRYWTGFARSGVPEYEGAVEWPAYEASSDRYLELGDTVEPGAGLYREACDLADRVRGSTEPASPGAAPRLPARRLDPTAVRSRISSSILGLLLRKRERRVLVGHEQQSVRRHPQHPPVHSHHEVEQRSRVAAGEQNGEPRYHHAHEGRDVQEVQDDPVRDGKEPLDQRHPTVELRSVRIGEVQVDGLLFVGGGILIAQELAVRQHAHEETGELQVPVVPPAGVLLAEEDHEQDRQEEDPAHGPLPRVAHPLHRHGARTKESSDDADGYDPQEAESGGEPVQFAVGIVHIVGERVAGHGGIGLLRVVLHLRPPCGWLTH